MTLVIRDMRDEEADAVAAMVHGLAQLLGTGFVPRVTGASLRSSRDLIDVMVAEDDGALIGACLGLMTFSTWRGARGLYIVDLFVNPQARGRNIGRDLLRRQARKFEARGARFIKLEVDESNAGAQRFYARIGFRKKSEDRLHILEQDELQSFISMGEET
jgi:ribosomal protein S18 acetylase RimI-like enzyme